MKTPKLLVVMPVYNAEPFLAKAIDSVLEQSFTDFILLVINDGSTDNSSEVIRSYTDPRLLMVEQGNQGPGSVMNLALEYAINNRIVYIARMDADDISLPHRFEKQLAILDQNPGLAACSGNCEYIDSVTETIIGTSTISVSRNIIQWEINHGLRGLIQGVCIFRSESLKAIGGYRTIFRGAEEVDVFLRLAEKFELANSKEYLYQIRLNPISLSMSDVHNNVLSQFYALDCSHRRRKGLVELEFEYYKNNLGLHSRYQIWREETVLRFWRRSFSEKKLTNQILAVIVDPRRFIIRLLRMMSKE